MEEWNNHNNGPQVRSARLFLDPFYYNIALGRGRTLRVGTTSSSQLRRHSGWSLALGRRYRSALELETGRTKKCIQMQNDSW